jgi:hypothetical protein
MFSRDDQPRKDRRDGIETVTNCANRSGPPHRRVNQSRGGPFANLCAAFAGQVELHEPIVRPAQTSGRAGVATTDFKHPRPR